MAELVDALDLGSSDESCGGSSPSARTTVPSLSLIDLLRPNLRTMQDAQDTNRFRGYRIGRDIGCSRDDEFSRSCGAPPDDRFRENSINERAKPQSLSLQHSDNGSERRGRRTCRSDLSILSEKSKTCDGENDWL